MDDTLEKVGTTTCANCNKEILQTRALVKTVETGPRSALSEHFCGQACFHTWYINRLRSFGL